MIAETLAERTGTRLKPAIEPRLAALTHREAIRAQAIGDPFDGDLVSG